MRYIGGEIEINKSNSRLRNNFDSKLLNNYSFHSTGRAALIEVLKHLKPEYPVLIPSYLCESILQPFIELEYEVEFYNISENLEINIESLIAKLTKGVFSAIYFINYFGFYDQRFRKAYKNGAFGSITLIEDCTHSTFIPNLLKKQTFFGHVVFGSLRKTLPVSDGAFIYHKEESYIESNTNRDNDFSRLKFQGKTLRDIFLKNQNLIEIEAIYLDLLSRAEEIINKKIPRTFISKNAYSILNQLDFASIYKQRRENYFYLSNKFTNNIVFNDKANLIREIDDYEMPYMMPIYIKGNNRDEIRIILRDRGVFTSVIWANPDVVNSKEFSSSKVLSEQILCLPIDQRYNKNDMDIIFEELTNILSNE